MPPVFCLNLRSPTIFPRWRGFGGCHRCSPGYRWSPPLIDKSGHMYAQYRCRCAGSFLVRREVRGRWNPDHQRNHKINTATVPSISINKISHPFYVNQHIYQSWPPDMDTIQENYGQPGSHQPGNHIEELLTVSKQNDTDTIHNKECDKYYVWPF